MFNQERRKFLSRTAMAAGGLAISPLADLQASVLSDGVKSPDYSSIKKAWNKSLSMSPEYYLHSRNLIKADANLDVASKEDFSQGRTLSVDGLMLSQTESAFVLVFGGDA
ncbi:MAG: twin-arginine translocation signal domain-containing protein [Planctomycetes bacterium]|nr:twin-arginine translocation signal domain-containing protein [Planctomycetota bacterium]|tara:strand:+ start:1130 stop:1459 length:330 start_codon:yes stop_codon:yes gene_type:complete